VESFPLALEPAMVNCIRSGSDVNFYLTAASATVGFTFNSRDYFDSTNWPVLNITAVPGIAAPEIRSIQRIGPGSVSISFNTLSNETYLLQCLDSLSNTTAANWSNLFTVAAQSTNGQVVYVDSITNRQRFYRLSVSP